VRILSRRFLASYLATLAACVGGCLLALAIVDMLVDFDPIVEGGPAALGALLARVPERWLGEALPLASFAAAFLAVALPARRGEILGLRAAGIHPARVTLPILGAALVVGVAASGLPARETIRERERFVPGSAASAWIQSGDRLVRVGHRDSRSGELRDVHWFETDSGFRLRRSLHAAQVRVAGDRWELRDPRELRFDPRTPAAAPRASPAPAWISAPQAGPGPTLASGPAADRRDVASRGVATASVLVLALLALPIGLGVRASGSLAGQALAALALAALFRGAWQAAAFATDRWALPTALAAGLVLAAFTAAAAACWTRAPR
jgi:lipopolysaccharide export LptBFGC system permease protein LptF